MTGPEASRSTSRRSPSALARHVVGRVVGWSFETAHTPPPGLVTGGVSADERPVVVAVLLGADVAAVTATAIALADVARRGGPRAVLLIDGPHFAAARRAGVIADHLLSPEAWASRHDPAGWDSYADEEIARLRRDLCAGAVVRLPPAGLAGISESALDALLDPQAPGSFRRWWRRRVVRLERRVDRGSD